MTPYDPPRLLWPSGPEEAARELASAGVQGAWPGPLGSPDRGMRAMGGAVVLRVPAPLAALLQGRRLPVGLNHLGGDDGRAALLLGEAGLLEAWAGGLGEPGAPLLQAVRGGLGRERPLRWKGKGGTLELGERTRIMAVVNVTPDSFYPGSRAQARGDLEHRLQQIAAQGADLVDIGGESSRPAAEPVSPEVERDRVVPAVALARSITGLPISVDTTRSMVAEAALEEGAAFINDISAGRDDPDLPALAACHGAGVVLMHRQGRPAVMQDDPHYHDLMGEIAAFLAERAAAARRAGLPGESIVIDPGLGFGKRRRHNFEIYRRVSELHALGYPLLAGPSRKRHTSGPDDHPVEDRIFGTAAAGALLARQGVQILRVHDVAAMKRVVETADEIRGAIDNDLPS